MRKLLVVLFAVVAASMLSSVAAAQTKPAAPAKGGAAGVKSKFYDFSDQLIDGDIKKPTALYTDARRAAQFGRLLNLKKSFLNPMLQTAKEQTFK
jgi:hypothetical protein